MVVESQVVVAVANRKGGTGKTTTAVNLAALWASQEYKTLLIDMDSQGHAGIGLGFKESINNQPTVHKIFYQEEFSLVEAINKTSIENLWFVPANREFNGMEVVNVINLLKSHLQQAMIQQFFDRIILDTPPSFDIVLMNALVAADVVLIPFLPHFLAEEGVRQLARTYYQIATKHNPSLRLVGLVPIMINKRIKAHRKVSDKLRDLFGNKVMNGIRNNILLAESFEAGIPIHQFAPKSHGSMDYQHLVLEVESQLKNIHNDRVINF